MKVFPNPGPRTAGSTLLISLFSTFLVGVALAYYLQLVANQNRLTYRSQTWNASMALVEAGVEEALSHCSYNSNNLASQGWSLSGGLYTKSNAVSVGYYVTTISTNAPYEIISRGHYPMPDSSTYVSRRVRVTTAPAPRFLGAMASKGTVDLNGNNVLVNSYDSRDPAKSTNGKYSAAKSGDNADVILASTGTAFDTGNGNIWGEAYTSPGVVAKTGPNGAIGSKWWNLLTDGIQTGWWINTANITIPDVIEPFGAATPPTSGTVGGVFYDYVLASGNYMMATLDKKCVATGDAVLYVTGTINSGTLTIQSNATVKIYGAGASATFSTINNNGTAVALQDFGLPTNTSLNVGGNWIGGIYAPSANFTIAGNTEVSGAVVAKNITMSGNSQFHYDEALGNASTPNGFLITSWNEL